MPSDFETDIVVIGAGPVGLFAVFEAGMLKMRCHVVDALESAGGQCAALYPEKPIYDIPGYPAIDASDLVKKLEAQAAPFQPVYHLGQRVEKVSRINAQEESRVSGQKENASRFSDSPNIRFELTTSSGTVIRCACILIAAGCGAFGPNRPPLANIAQFEGKSVFYLVKQKEAFRDKKIVIAGGGDSAVDWAISLAPLAQKIYVIHRRPKFRCAPESASRLEALAKTDKVELVIPYQLDTLHGMGGMLNAVTVATLDGETRLINADILLPFFGLAMELGPIADWGLHLDENRIAVSPETLATSQQGIFAAGDIAAYPGKLKLILCGFSEAAMAMHAMYPLVHAGKALHFEYSTTKGVP